jgi:molecular chaperone GrpE
MENEKNVDQSANPTEEIKNEQDDTLQTDNMAETEAAEEKKKSGIFSKKSSKEKARIQELEEKVKQLETEKMEQNDRFLRLYSEFDNYKKRVGKEKLELLSTASEKVIVNLLPVVDDFERAIEANRKADDVAAIKEGFVLIYNKLVQLLKRFDVEEIAAKGEVFNTDFHEAVTHFPTDKEEEKGKVIDVTEKGYKIKEKVIRYAKVVVGQ